RRGPRRLRRRRDRRSCDQDAAPREGRGPRSRRPPLVPGRPDEHHPDRYLRGAPRHRQERAAPAPHPGGHPLLHRARHPAAGRGRPRLRRQPAPDGRGRRDQRWWNDHAVNRFHVTLAPGADAEVVRRAIAGGVGAVEGLKVLTQRELYAYHQDAVGRAFRFTRALEVLPLIVAGLGLAEALIAVSLDRRRELALLRAAGATRGQVARSVVAEAAGVGLLGLA